MAARSEAAHDERVRLAKLALKAMDDAAAYRAAREGNDEFASEDDPLAREGAGWEEFTAKG